MNRIHRHHPMLVRWVWLLATTLLACSSTAAQEGATTQFTILVRDTAGHPLPGIHILVIPDAPEGVQPTMDMGAAHQITDAAGTAHWPDLPQGNYVVQFDTMVPFSDGRPIQPVALQNRATDDVACSPLPGFCLRVIGVATWTARFVMGGTAVADHTVPATPFWDLADSDRAPVRPVLPILGLEITAAEAAQQGGSFEIRRAPPNPALRAPAPQQAPAHDPRRWWLVGGAAVVALMAALGLLLRGRPTGPAARAAEDREP